MSLGIIRAQEGARKTMANGELPEGASEWPQRALSSAYSVKYGRANPGRPGNIPVVGSSGIYARTEVPLVLHPTIVVGRKGSAGQPWLINEPSFPSDTAFYLDPIDPANMDLGFTYYALRQFQISASDDVIPSLQRHELENMLVPSPSLPEQRAIAGVLSKLQGAVEAQDKIIATLKELKAATLAKLFREGLRGEPLKQTEIGEIPESWEVVPLKEVVELQRGFDLPSRLRKAGNVPVVSSSGVTGTHESAMVKGPGVVTGRYGTLGQVFYVEEDFWPLNTTLFVKDFKGNNPLFVSYLLQTLQMGDHNDKSAVPGVNRNSLHIIPVGKPQPDEQAEIGASLAMLEKKIRVAEAEHATAGRLFSSMLHLLMTGDLRLQRQHAGEEGGAS
jgi:type I restriction enzyme S subunit